MFILKKKKVQKGHNFNFFFLSGKDIKMEKIKSVSVSHLFFVPWSNTACSYKGSPSSWAREEQSWGWCWLCVGTRAVSAEDGGWEVELPQMFFPGFHLLRQGEEVERERKKKT